MNNNYICTYKNRMKCCLAIAVMICLTQVAISQPKFPLPDQSAMDMAYYPPNYPILKIQDKITEPLVVRILYSRPQRNGRGVFGELVEYDKVWRVGANEATEIEFFKDVYFGGKPVPKGRYSLYAIPSPEKWVMIINTETDTWGSFKYDSKKDVVRLEMPVQKMAETAELLSFVFDKISGGFSLSIAWENTSVTIPLSVNTKTPIRTPVKVIKKK